MNNKLGINFEACFPQEERQPLEIYLSGVNKTDLLKISSFFLGFNTYQSEFSDIGAFLTMYFSSGNREFAKTVYTNIVDYVNKVDYPIEMYEIPYIKSSLFLFEFIFDKVPDDEHTTKSKEEIERDIFKAYVALNQITITEYEEQRRYFDEARGRTLSSSEVILANSFHNNDLINYREDKLFSSQLLRAVLLFRVFNPTRRL